MQPAACSLHAKSTELHTENVQTSNIFLINFTLILYSFKTKLALFHYIYLIKKIVLLNQMIYTASYGHARKLRFQHHHAKKRRLTQCPATKHRLTQRPATKNIDSHSVLLQKTSTHTMFCYKTSNQTVSCYKTSTHTMSCYKTSTHTVSCYKTSTHTGACYITSSPRHSATKSRLTQCQGPRI